MPHPVRLILLASLWLIGSAAALHAARPNFLFLFADDQRAGTSAAHGNPHIRTSFIDTLVRDGVSFRRNYVFGNNSGAACVPSRAMLHTGKHWFRFNTQTLAGEKLMGELFGEHGYTTFGTGRWHNSQPSWLRSFQQGWSVMFGGTLVLNDGSTPPPRVDLTGKERTPDQWQPEEIIRKHFNFSK